MTALQSEIIRIRPETAADHKAIRNLTTEAFSGPQEAHLVDALRHNGDLALSLVADAGGSLAGHIALSQLVSPVGVMALAPLAELTQKQGRGIGAALVTAAIRGARDLCAKALFVVGDPIYYTRFGFSTGAAAPFPCRYAGAHFMALTWAALRPDDVVYAKAFDALG